MAIFGIYTAAQAVTATDAADTIAFFGASAVSTANTVIAGNGDDIIWLGAQGYTAVYTGTQAGTLSGTPIISASLIGQDITYSTSFTYAATGSSTGNSLTGVITSQAGARQIRYAGLYGNAGNDSIYLAPVFTAGATAAPGFTNFQNSTIGGGAGDDLIGTISFVASTAVTGTATTAAVFDEALIEGGGGNDTIVILGNSGLYTATSIQGGQGNDILNLDDELGGFTADSQLLGGGGDDVISGRISAFNSATVAGGGGNDSITLSAAIGHATLFALDTFNVASQYDGNDLLSAFFTGGNVGSASGITIQAGGGNDSIHIGVSAGIAQSNVYQLNAGDDLLSSVLISSTTIEGGAGNDTIQGMSSMLASYAQLGGGNDVFTFNGSASAMATGLSATTLFGGAGADLFSGTAGVANARMTMGAQWGYASAGDSNISATDSIHFSNTGGSYLFRWTPGNASTTSFNTSTFTATNGSVNFTGTFANGVTARAEALSQAGFSAGSTFAFIDGNNNSYLFISGGTSTSMADDLVVKVGTAGVASGGSIAVSAQVGITMTVGIN